MAILPFPHPVMVLADLHLTARRADEYRWRVFDWIAEKRPATVLILGDLTDEKDHHSAVMVNRLLAEITNLVGHGVHVVWLIGNHDYIDPQLPFFSFLKELGVVVITNPVIMKAVLFLPHTRTPKEDWSSLSMQGVELICMHQTVSGVVASNGQQMQGELEAPSVSIPIISGDIHVPQIVSGVEYVGSPYHVHFGDRFTPRALWYDESGERSDIHYPFPQKYVAVVKSVEDVKALQLGTGDQVKVRVDIPRHERVRWEEIKLAVEEQVKNSGAVLKGMELVPKKMRKALVGDQELVKRGASRSPRDALFRFCAFKQLSSDLRSAGEDLL